MLKRLRGVKHEAAPAAEAAAKQRDGAAADLTTAATVEAAAAMMTPAPRRPGASKPLSVDEKAALGDGVVPLAAGLVMPFSRQELGRIKKRFVGLLPADSLTHITTTSCLTMPELAPSPFAWRVLQLALSVVESDGSLSVKSSQSAGQCVAFDAFLTVLSIFSVKQPVAVKRLVLFSVYDADRDGRVSVDDFAATLHAIAPWTYRAELNAAVATRFSEWTHAGESSLDMDSFQQESPPSRIVGKAKERTRSGFFVSDFNSQMVKWNIATFARIRPPRRSHECANFILEKIENGSQSAACISFPPPGDSDEPGASTERFSMKQRELLQFQYANIFDPGVSQDEVFNTVCRDIVYSALDGYNGTILAYGQTGSGKTYTITGGEHYADRGIIPRVLSTIFEEFERRSSSVRYACYVSYLEIYNENVYDLLDRSHTDRPIEEWTKVLLMDDDEGEMHFRNLGVYEAVSEEEALNLLFLGNMNRVTSDTPMNQASSRSHSIFSVMLEARPVDSDVIVTSKLHLVDLAGSERVYKRQGTQRMRTEGKHINLSLHHLEQVILSLRAAKKSNPSALAKGFHVPYRNSMLTSVLRGSLGGNCRSVFIATLNPESAFVDESISTCRFMQRCAEVSVDVAVNSEVDTEKRLLALEKANGALEAANGELRSRLAQLGGELETSNALVAQHQQDQMYWQRERVEMLAQLELLQSRQQQREDEPLDWGVCEELVEKLLLTGDVSRSAVASARDESTDIEEEENAEDDDEQEARQLFQEVVGEVRRRGVECAVGCLWVLRESTVFASNTAAELQELMDAQRQTVQLLEKRLDDQKSDAEQLKAQLRQLSHAAVKASDHVPRTSSNPSLRPATQSASSSRAGDGGGQRLTASSHSNRSTGGAGSSRAESGSSHSDSDSDLDSEAPDSRQYPHPNPHSHHHQPHHLAATTMSLVFNAGPRSSYTGPPAPVAPLPPVISIKTPAIDPVQPPPPPPAATKSGSDVIRRRMELLKNGSLFIKYGRFGKPHVRFVWCSADLEYVHYRQAGAQLAKAAIPTRNMQRVVLGQSSKVFERARQPTREPFCFSIEYDESGASRTLDLEITDGESSDQKQAKRSEWVEALQFLIKLKAAQQQKKNPQPPGSSGGSSS